MQARGAGAGSDAQQAGRHQRFKILGKRGAQARDPGYIQVRYGLCVQHGGKSGGAVPDAEALRYDHPGGALGGDSGWGEPPGQPQAAAGQEQHREHGHKHHPRDRRPRPHQGLPIPAGGHHPGGERYGCHQRHHEGIISPGGQDLPDHPIPGGAGHPPRHRGSLGQRRLGHPAKVFRLYGFQYQGKAHQL